MGRVIRHIVWPLTLTWLSLRLIFRLPWWVFAGATLWLGWATVIDVPRHIQSSARLSADVSAGKPPLVFLNEFDRQRDVTRQGEVFLAGIYNPEEPVRETEAMGSDIVYVSIGVPGSDKVAAVIVAPKTRARDLMNILPERNGWRMIRISGRLETSSVQRETIANDLALNGKNMLDDFPIILPFLDGRERSLMRHGDGEIIALITRMFAVILLFFATVFVFFHPREKAAVLGPQKSPTAPPSSMHGPWGRGSKHRLESDTSRDTQSAASVPPRLSSRLVVSPRVKNATQQTKTVDEIIQGAFGTSMRAKILQNRKR